MNGEAVVTYTSTQIDAGQFGGEFHPVTGERLSELRYDEARHQFYSSDHWPESGLGWSVTVRLEQKRRYRPRIGDGRDRATGELYHDHWQFDPFTGEPLQPMSPRGLWEQE